MLASLTLLAAASRAIAQEEPTPPSIGPDKSDIEHLKRDVSSDALSLLQKIAKQARNPLPDQINIPIMPTFNFGPGHVTQFVLEIEPVIPFHLPNDWNLVTRTDLTVINQPGTEPGQGDTFGFGDTQFWAFVAPPNTVAPALIWGVGPIILSQPHRRTSSEEASGGWGPQPLQSIPLGRGNWDCSSATSGRLPVTAHARRLIR